MNAHIKQQQDNVFETDFIDSQKSDPPFAHLFLIIIKKLYVFCFQCLSGRFLKEFSVPANIYNVGWQVVPIVYNSVSVTVLVK